MYDATTYYYGRHTKGLRSVWLFVTFRRLKSCEHERYGQFLEEQHSARTFHIFLAATSKKHYHLASLSYSRTSCRGSLVRLFLGESCRFNRISVPLIHHSNQWTLAICLHMLQAVHGTCRSAFTQRMPWSLRRSTQPRNCNQKVSSVPLLPIVPQSTS